MLEAGGKLHAELPGGGGYGNPRERDRRAVIADVLDGYVSKRAAKEIYGVDLDGSATV